MQQRFVPGRALTDSRKHGIVERLVWMPASNFERRRRSIAHTPFENSSCTRCLSVCISLSLRLSQVLHSNAEENLRMPKLMTLVSGKTSTWNLAMPPAMPPDGPTAGFAVCWGFLGTFCPVAIPKGTRHVRQDWRA